MSQQDPLFLLSLCIPTKNRAELLDRCLNAIFNAPHYDSQLIEVVVSDNASTDNTQEIVEKHIAKGRKIIYNRNKENLGVGAELNFIKALSLANGRLLKLLNDYTELTDSAIEAYLSLARTKAEEKPSIIFLQDKRRAETSCATLDELVAAAEWNLTWIGTHVYWKEEWDALPDKTRAITSCFMQIDWFLRLCDEKRAMYIERGDFFHNIKLANNKVTYNWFDVHMTNFFSVLLPYVEKGNIKRRTYDRVKYILYKAMCHSFKDRCFKQIGNGDISRKEVIKVFVRNYKEYWWFYPRFSIYVAKLYVKQWIGYWWLQRQLK